MNHGDTTYGYQQNDDKMINVTAKNYPEVYLVGMPKAGTTALFQILSQSKSIFQSTVKEPNYFTPNLNINHQIKNENDYLDLYKLGVSNGQKCIDASVSYCHEIDALKGIKKCRPDAKVILVIRKPSAQVVSQYQQMLYSGYEEIQKFDDAWTDRISNGPPITGVYKNIRDYPRSGSIPTVLKKVQSVFEPNNIAVVVFEELIKNPEQTIEQLCSFLDIDQFKFSIDPTNEAKYPRWVLLHKIILGNGVLFRIAKTVLSKIPFLNTKKLATMYFSKMVKKEKVRVSEKTYKMLDTYFADDQKRVEEILNRKIELW